MKDKKVLIIKLGAIGDVVHTSIIPYAIKNKHPNWQIHYMTSPLIATLLKNCSYIDKVIAFDTRAEKPHSYMFNHVLNLMKERYDYVFCLSHSLRLFILSFGSLPKKVVFRGYKGNSWVENYFYSAADVIKDLELPERLVLEADSAVKEKVSNWMMQYPKPHVVINPGFLTPVGRQGRVWPLNYWKELADKILKTYGGTVFVNGGGYEYEYQKPLASERVIFVPKENTLEDNSVVLALADAVISGDSGPLHIASAFDVNTLAILGSTSPDDIRPYGAKGHYIGPDYECKYCWEKQCKKGAKPGEYPPCISSISPDAVMEKIKEYNLI